MPDQAPTPDPVLRALADAAEESRPRRPEDAADLAIPVAATVVLLRDADAGPEVLLLERPDRGSFAGAWVFPGGKLEDVDRLAADESEEDAARRAGVRETSEESGLVVDPDALVTVSCWDPPPDVALRIRTWFFAVRAPEGELLLQAEEAVAAEWVAPADMLARHGRGEVRLYPPTWVTLHDLAPHPDVESVLDAARLSGVHRFESVARRGAEGPMLLWQGDAAYESDASAAGPTRPEAPPGAKRCAERAWGASDSRHRLEIGALPWRYTRRG